MSEAEALKSLGAFPVVQAALSVIIVLVGIWMFMRGGRDSNKSSADNQQSVPQWVMMGPVADAIGAIHDMAEQSRKQADLLERIEENSRRSAETAHNNTGVLEMIRNESRLR